MSFWLRNRWLLAVCALLLMGWGAWYLISHRVVDEPPDTSTPGTTALPRSDFSEPEDLDGRSSPLTQELDSAETGSDSTVEIDVHDRNDLIDRVTAFEEALHSWSPEFESEQRTHELRRYSTDDFWREIELQVADQAADETMAAEGMRVNARAEIEEIELRSGEHVEATTRIYITVETETEIVTTYEPRHITNWIKQDGEWRISAANYA